MNDPSDLFRQFAALQPFWNALQVPAGGFGAFGNPGAVAGFPGAGGAWPWGNPAEPWNRSATPSAGIQTDAAERLLEQGKRYLGMLQGLVGGQAFDHDNPFDPRKWFEDLREMHQRYGGSLAGAGSSVPWFGGIDTGHIEQLVRSFALAPAGDLRSELEGWLNLPAFGPAREHQERGQKIVRAYLDYQVANARYVELMLTTTSRTLELLETKLAEHDEAGRRLESARAIYNLCIDAAEDAFAEVAMSAEYAQVNGDLVNTQMRVRVAINDEIERLTGQFGMPTRTEVDSLGRQVHELKRELRRRKDPEPAADRAPSSRPAAKRAKTVRATKTVKAKTSRKPAAAKTSKPAARKPAKPAKSTTVRRSVAKRVAATPEVRKPVAAKDAGAARGKKSKMSASGPVLRSTKG